MSQTPTKVSVKRLPMIVDIALDPDGKQLYQVHELLKMVRKEMPRLTNFTSQSLIPDEEKTPIRKILGTILPLTLNQKKTEHDLEVHHDVTLNAGIARKANLMTLLSNDPLSLHANSGMIPGDSSSSDMIGLDKEKGGLELGYSDFPTPAKPPTGSSNSGSNDDNDIWSTDVESAFEEVLLIIPKNGLLKIKISGRSCGRNELISDYIFQKTGKFRTRKQVSSHIQVIKNLGQKGEIIRLINDGPIFESEDERIENMEKFETIFLKITLAKLMGVSDNIGGKRQLRLQHHSNGGMVGGSSSSMSNKRVKRANTYSIENYFIALIDSTGNSFNLSRQSLGSPMKSLKLKQGANLSGRFPGLNELADIDAPLLHIMVKMKIPSLVGQLQSLQSNFQIRNTIENRFPVESSVFSCVYLFGQEVLKTNDMAHFNENVPFLPKFWEFFFKELLSRGGTNDVVQALKGVTIKQIIYDVDPNDEGKKMIAKLRIQGVLLWEFCGVDSYNDAVTSTSLLSFPLQLQLQLQHNQFGPELHAPVVVADSNVVPQVVEYGSQQSYPYGQQYSSQSVQVIPGQQLALGMNQTLPMSSVSYGPSMYGRSAASTAHTLAVKSEFGYYDGLKPGPVHGKYSSQDAYQYSQVQHPPYQGNYLHASANVDLMLETPSSVHYYGQEAPGYSTNNGVVFGSEQGGYINSMDNAYIGK